MINYVPKKDDFCDYCRIMVPCITGHEADQISSSERIEETRALMGHPNTAPRQIWNRIRDFGPKAVRHWFPGNSNGDERWAISERPPEWELMEEDVRVLSKRKGESGTLEQLRRLQRVVPCLMAATSRGSRENSTWMASAYKSHTWVIEDPQAEGYQGNKLKSLLLSISVAVTRYTENHYGRPPDRFSSTHPAHLLLFEPRPNSPWAHMMRRRGRSKGVVNIPVEEVEGTKWMRLWREWLAKNSNMATHSAADKLSVPVSLFISDGGRLQLRVRRDHGWRKLEVGSHPETWSKIVTWALSPPGHDYRDMFQCIQQSLFASPDSPVIREDERRGISLLRSVVHSNDRAKVDVSLKSFRIVGESGLRYLVRPGSGAHGTRFTVWGFRNQGPDDNRWDHEALQMLRGRHNEPPICIVETPELRRLVIGDAVASVVMALLDDINSSKSVNTLRNHISNQRARYAQIENPDIAQMNEARWFENRLRINRVADRVRRYTESFPTLWGVLLRVPLGERITFRSIRDAGPRPNISFDDCDTGFTTRNMVERRAIYEMLGESGWTREREEEAIRDVQRIYIRTGTGDRDLGNSVREISQILEPELRINGRVQMIQRQLWTYFERVNPGPSALLPGSDQNIE